MIARSADPAGRGRAHVVLLSTYDLGRQPFGLASPAAWLRRAGFRVTCHDLAVEPLDDRAVRDARLIAFHLPMHTATRLAVGRLDRVRQAAPDADVAFYGLYAPVNEPMLRALGACAVLGGEFEQGLVDLARRLERAVPGAPQAQIEPRISLARQAFIVPEREGLAALERYAHVHVGDGSTRAAGYTEASRGCKHLCRHCPVVPVYGGRFRVVQPDVVLADIDRQVAAGARHVTFGDPDFFNGIRHAVGLVRALHARYPGITYDVTVKVEHLLRHRRHLCTLRDTGCLFVTSAVESLDDGVLERLDKGHTRTDFFELVRACRDAGVTLNPTFVAFHPWIDRDGYVDLLRTLADLALVDHVAPIQVALRLLIPRGSRLLELADVRSRVGPFDDHALVYPWTHDDPAMDDLHARVQRRVEQGAARGASRREIFAEVLELASSHARTSVPPLTGRPWWAQAAAVPYLTEPWYC